MRLHKRTVIIIASSLIVVSCLLVLGIETFFSYQHLSPQQIIEYNNSLVHTPGFTGGISQTICTLKVDRLPIFVFIDDSDQVTVAFFDGKGNKDSLVKEVGFCYQELMSNDFHKSSCYYDNINGNRTVLGFCSNGKAPEIIVNGKSVSKKNIIFKIRGKVINIDLWYVVLKGTPQYSIIASHNLH